MSRADELNRFVLWHIDLHKNEYGNLVYFNQAERIITELEQKLAALASDAQDGNAETNINRENKR